MKKKLIIIVVILGLIGGYFLFSKGETSPISSSQQETNQLENSGQATNANTEITSPAKLTIPSIDVDASIENVGLDSKGNMDVPKNDMNVAWYQLGYKPGQQGSAVFAGHFDTRSGNPAVFYNVEKLKSGDEITVSDDSGKSFTYQVTEVKKYAFDKVPLEEVFASNDKARLNLITCEGTFNKASQNYSHRIVVYSELKE